MASGFEGYRLDLAEERLAAARAEIEHLKGTRSTTASGVRNRNRRTRDEQTTATQRPAIFFTRYTRG